MRAAVLIVLGASLVSADASDEKVVQTEPPVTYTLDYAPATRFCPPIRDYFAEVARTQEMVRGRPVVHQKNGGYGLPVVIKVGDRNLLHLGADVGWFQPGEPVHAVAAGVVRRSEGPATKTGTSRSKGKQPSAGSSKGLGFGSMVVIEHRLPDGAFATTIYAHLSGKRLVKTGDLVEAGQPIGEIGRKGVINGGFDPHLHFGVHQGRLGEEGVVLFALRQQGRPVSLVLAKLGETEIEITAPPAENALPARLTVNGVVYPITMREGKHYLPAQLLWSLPGRPGFQIAGYGLTTDGWLDPTAFLTENGARLTPAPLRSAN